LGLNPSLRHGLPAKAEKHAAIKKAETPKRNDINTSKKTNHNMYYEIYENIQG
jgi:hypothetical protein